MSIKFFRGFTLLEVVVSISLLGLMLLLVGSALGTGNRTLAVTGLYSDRLNEVRAAQGFLREGLQRAIAMKLLVSSDSNIVFEGGETYMRFLAPVTPHLGGGMKVHKLDIVDKQQGGLTLGVSFSDSADGKAWGTRQVLMTSFSRAKFSYRGLDDAKQPTGWLEAWPWPTRLPQYVKIDVDMDAPVHWPTLIVAVRLNMSGGYFR